MKVIFLAAGRSKRMAPIPDKNFLEFCGRSLIFRQFEILTQAGFFDFLIIGGAHNIEKLREFAKNPETQRLFGNRKSNIVVLEQVDLDSGMAGAVLTAQSSLSDEPVLVVNSNDILDLTAFSAVLNASKDEIFESFLLAKKVSEYFPGGYLEVGADGSLSTIIEKPAKGSESSDLVNIVVHFHRNPTKLFQYLKNTHSDRDDRYEMALSSMLHDGIRMKAVPYDDFWQAIKYPWHIFPAERHFFSEIFLKTAKKIADSADIAPSAVIKGDVIIGEGVRIFDVACVNGPAYIGDGTIVANHALVRDSFIGRNCVIGYSTEVARSVVGNDVWFHTNYIGDSVICDNCAFGSGAVTGNLRLDEKNVCVETHGEKIDCGSNKIGALVGPNVRIGINTSLMPGVKIGADTFIGSGIVVGKDIAEGSYVTGKWELEIRPNRTSMNVSAREKMRKNL
ncbi:NTP transferase domain-containing protein [Candidatus Peregrinibacteria bacterium]|nr:NTP transferase domain-containing protein [Candidatus Peregrinibacteria bacterium]